MFVDYIQWRAHVSQHLGELDHWLLGLHTTHRAADPVAINAMERRIAMFEALVLERETVRRKRKPEAKRPRETTSGDEKLRRLEQ